MSIGDIVSRVIGIVMAVFGLVVMLSTVRGLPATWILVLAGLGCLILGLYILGGGKFTL